MKGKIAAVLLLILLSLFLFAGCAESFTYTYYIDKTGALHYEYVFTYDPYASDADEVKEEALEVAEVFLSMKDFGDRAKLETGEGRVSLSITFDSVTDYYIFNGMTGKEKPDESETFLQGIFQYQDSVGDPYRVMSATFRSLLDEDHADAPDPAEMRYVFGTRFSSVRSNADRVEERGGIYYHVWDVTSGEPLNVVIRTYGLNVWLLFGAAICVFVLSLVALFVIIYFKDKKDRGKFSIGISSSGEGNAPVNDEIEPSDPFDFDKGD